MKSNILRCAAGLAISAALAGCSASKSGPFTDVTTRDQQQAGDVQPTTRPVEAPNQPTGTSVAPAVTVTDSAAATPAANVATHPATVVPANVVAVNTAQPTAPAATTGKLIVHVDERGRLTRDFAPSTFERPSGDVKAGPMYWPMSNRSVKRGDLENVAFEPMEFIVDSLLMPVRACITPPWTDVVYDAVPQDNTVPATVNARQPVTQERVLKKQ